MFFPLGITTQGFSYDLLLISFFKLTQVHCRRDKKNQQEKKNFKTSLIPKCTGELCCVSGSGKPGGWSL